MVDPVVATVTAGDRDPPRDLGQSRVGAVAQVDLSEKMYVVNFVEHRRQAALKRLPREVLRADV
jgi:hypothetical protein